MAGLLVSWDSLSKSVTEDSSIFSFLYLFLEEFVPLSFPDFWITVFSCSLSLKKVLYSLSQPLFFSQFHNFPLYLFSSFRASITTLFFILSWFITLWVLEIGCFKLLSWYFAEIALFFPCIFGGFILE